MKLALLAILFCGSVAAQNVNGQYTVIGSIAQLPVTCSPTQTWLLTPTGVIYTCQSGVPAVATGGGGGGTPSAISPTFTLNAGNSYTYVWTHNLNARGFPFSCYDTTSFAEVTFSPSPTYTTVNTITIVGTRTQTLICYATTGGGPAGPTGPSGPINLIQQSGVPLTVRPTLNCTGGGITCSDDAGNSRTNISVPPVVSGCMTAFDVTVSGSPAASIPVTIPGTCYTVILDIVGNTTSVTGFDALAITLNGDNSNAYAYNTTGSKNGGTAINFGDAAFHANAWIAVLSGAGSVATTADVTLTIPGYTGTTKTKSGTSVNAANADLAGISPVGMQGGFLWNNTAAVTLVTFFSGLGNNFPIGTNVHVTGR